MKRFFLLFLLIVAMAAFYYRQQIYVRDFRATVTRNGVVEDGAQVFFSINDDVLLENDNAPTYITLLQHDKPAMIPKQLNCVHFLVCYAKADNGFAYSDIESRPLSMTSQGAEYKDDNGKNTIVKFH